MSVWLFDHFLETLEHFASSLTDKRANIFCETSVGRTLSGSEDERCVVKARSPRRDGDVARDEGREEGRDDGRDLEAGVPGSEMTFMSS